MLFKNIQTIFESVEDYNKREKYYTEFKKTKDKPLYL